MPQNIHSKAQFGLFAAICRGAKGTKAKGLKKDKACESMMGVKVSKLPQKVTKK